MEMRTSADEFPIKVRREAWRRCGGRCEWPECGFIMEGKVSHFDHVKPVSMGGDNSLQNCQILCVYHHAMKTGEEAAPRAKANRLTDREANIKRPRVPMPGSRLSKYKRRMDGTVVRREE